MSGPTRRHINFGNDNSFLKTGGASREERLTILNENPVDETKERCPEGGPMAIEASLPWEKTGLSPLGLPVVHVPKGLEAHQSHGLSRSLLGMPPWQKLLCTDYSKPWILNQVMLRPFPTPRGHLAMSGDNLLLPRECCYWHLVDRGQ